MTVFWSSIDFYRNRNSRHPGERRDPFVVRAALNPTRRAVNID